MDNWSHDDIFEFLHAYKEEPIIWNLKHPHSKDRYKVYEAWKRVSEKLNGKYSFNEMKSKKKTLMSIYRKLAKTVDDRLRNDHMVFKPEWFAYEMIDGFIREVRFKSQPDRQQPSTSAEVDDPVICSVIPLACKPSTSNVQQAFQNSPTVVHNPSDEDDQANTVSSGVRSRNVLANLDKSACSTKNGSRKRPASSLDEVHDRMDYAFNCLQSLTEKPKPDECSLYMEIFERKLRALDENTREIAMIEINNLLFRLKRQPGIPLTFPHSFSLNQNSFTSSGVGVAAMMPCSSQQQPMPNFFVQPASSTPSCISVSSTSSPQCVMSNTQSVEMSFEAETLIDQEESIIEVKQE